MLSQLTRQQEPHSCLNLARRQRLLLVVSNKLGCLTRDLLKDVVDKAVHDRHATLGDARLGMHLLEHTIDVDRVCFTTVLAKWFLWCFAFRRRVLCRVLRGLAWRSLFAFLENHFCFCLFVRLFFLYVFGC